MFGNFPKKLEYASAELRNFTFSTQTLKEKVLTGKTKGSSESKINSQQGQETKRYIKIHRGIKAIVRTKLLKPSMLEI